MIMKAVLTLDNGHRFVADVLTPPAWLRGKPIHSWTDFERDFVRNFNLSQPRMLHKVVSAHILRN